MVLTLLGPVTGSSHDRRWNRLNLKPPQYQGVLRLLSHADDGLRGGLHDALRDGLEAAMAVSLGLRAFRASRAFHEVAEVVEGGEACTFPGPGEGVLVAGVCAGLPGRENVAALPTGGDPIFPVRFRSGVDRLMLSPWPIRLNFPSAASRS